MPQSCRSVDQFGFGSWRSWSDRVNAVAQFIKTILDPFHGDRLKARPHYAQAVADAGPDLTNDWNGIRALRIRWRGQQQRSDTG
jgi:hypothetical protein